MNNTPPKLQEEMNNDPEYKTCMRRELFHDHECKGRMTREHALIYAGRQIQEKFAIISICAWSHDVDEHQGGNNLDKPKNEYIALLRATDEDLRKYPNRDWKQHLKYLNGKYKLI